jgi:hypothetical protein
LACSLLQYESLGWAAEILDAATTASVRQLPRLYAAAARCLFTGRPEAAVRHAPTAVALEADPRFDGFQYGFSRFFEAGAYLYAAGQVDRYLDIAADAQPEFARLCGRCWVV